MHSRAPRFRLSYANVASSLALFLALGGSSYAAFKLPRNSVGTRQLKAGAVRSADVRNGSIRSVDVRNGSLGLHDMAPRTRHRLRGKRGPAGPAGASAPSLFVEVDASGGHRIGNGLVIGHVGTNGYSVGFPRSVATCALVASPANVPGGAVPDAPPGATVIVSHVGNNALVRTFNAQNQPQGLPFSLIAAC